MDERTAERKKTRRQEVKSIDGMIWCGKLSTFIIDQPYNFFFLLLSLSLPPPNPYVQGHRTRKDFSSTKKKMASDLLR
jgi:hypothetical protein